MTLKDGTVLRGFLKDVQGDSYVIQTQTIGQLTIPIVEVLSITPAMQRGQSQGQTSVLPSQSFEGMVQDIQQDFLTDPAFVAEVETLAQDQEFVKLILDPNFISTLMSMDPVQIQSHPSVQKILQNPKMIELMQKIGQKMGINQLEGMTP
jgi:hypothetical protein